MEEEEASSSSSMFFDLDCDDVVCAFSDPCAPFSDHDFPDSTGTQRTRRSQLIHTYILIARFLWPSMIGYSETTY